MENLEENNGESLKKISEVYHTAGKLIADIINGDITVKEAKEKNKELTKFLKDANIELKNLKRAMNSAGLSTSKPPITP